MRFRSIAVGTLLSLAATGSARAQGTPDCAGGAAGTPAQYLQDACQQAVDLFKYMVPQLGIGVIGGNTTLGQGGALGGLPHFALGIRANLLSGSVPIPQTPATNGAQARTDYPTENRTLGLPAVDLAIGVFKGLPLALSNVGGIDLLVSANYVPDVETDNVTIATDNPLKIGYGARLGIIQESLLLPGIGVSFMKRDLPKMTITGFTADDSLSIQDLDFKTTAWRVTASKSLVLFTIAAGVGQDTYDVKTGIAATINEAAPVGRQTLAPVPIEQKITRTNYFADVSMNIMLLKIVGTVGMVSGGDIPTYNAFSTPADDSRLYGSVGVRLGF